ncbi:dTMP kinase [Catalinimonas niigatensis]|uniref:dTMP kinase n=1 Tax=Catalinimonas niigatensis TaxID=1397264 RepID=UPI0026653EB6|nr:dTMP kinase [Catalinimonas niigatensis]WPP52414.1 dTMP kinase [Catalinimonas niigatensis]
MRKNVFIALEGIDGSGKSTQIKLLAKQLEKAGHQVYTTFEPTDSPIGKMIRDIFSHRMEADHKVIAGLFVADRLNHLLNKSDGILKKLEEGYTVLTDRYYLSSYAYHSVHMDMDWVIQANAMSAELLRPDLNIYIDIPPEISMERINRGRASIEMYETLDNLRQVREKYYEAFDKVKEEENIYITNSNRAPEEVATDIWNEVSRLLI